MVWVGVVAAWVVIGAATSGVAVRRGHDRVLWLVLGLVFPVAALVALLLGFPRTQPHEGHLAADVREALRHSRVARVLAAQAGLDEDAIRSATGMHEDRVVAELRTLRVLGLVRRARDRTWSLSGPAAAAMAAEADDAGGS